MKKNSCYLFVLFALIMFFCVWHMVSDGLLCNMTYSREIDAVGLISLLITSAITIWIGLTITHRLAERNSAKQFLIEDIHKIESQLDILESFSYEEEVDTKKVFKIITVISKQIEVFKTSIICFDIKSIRFEKLNESYRQLYMVSTDAESTKVKMNDGINTHIKNLKEELRFIASEINKE